MSFQRGKSLEPQNGGSHHIALVLAQKKEQNRKYTVKAKVNTHVLDQKPLKDLQSKYYFLVTGKNAHDNFNGMNDIDTIIYNAISPTRREITLSDRSTNPPILFIIKKSSLIVNEVTFERWVENQIKRGTIIELSKLLESTLKYCTEPYLHELNQIFLGDPLHRNNKELSRLIQKNKDENKTP